jgi:hypothetical protein
MSQAVRSLLILVVLMLCCAGSLYAQFLSTQKTVVVSPDSNNVFLNFFTRSETIQVTHADSSISSNQFSFDETSGVLTFHWPNQWTSLPVELTVRWQYRPVLLPGTVRSPYGIIYSPNDSLGSAITEFISPQSPLNGFSSDLVSTGSITRGVIVGNSRDPGLESGLNFNLQGQLTENIELSASLSDQNAIIQPEGTTQNLREFDQVFIRLQTPNEQIQMGDVDAVFNQSSIARLQRRIQGAVLASDRDATGANQAVLSVQRGTFRTMEFRGREGIQGPYRLTGQRGESFIIVVAGTERVFLDGQLLERGEDLDYIIDYSIGEVTFTGANLIRSSHRIRIEFQYLSSSYNRTLFAAESEQTFGDRDRFSVGATFIREADAISFAESSFLSEQELDVIRQAGADESRMRVSGADSVGYRPDAPYALYVARDTLILGEVTRFYVFSPGNPQAAFRVSFTRVGQGNGSYRRSGGGVNGIVYEWVGQGAGDYEPFRQLTGPKQTQLLAIRGKARIIDGIETSAEWAGSNFNPNRLSPTVDGLQDQMVRGQIGLGSQNIGLGRVSAGASIEHKGRDFKFFDRIRDAEFDRLWGLQGASSSDETRYQSNIQWDIGSTSSIRYDLQKLTRDDRNGTRHDVLVNSEEAMLPFLDARIGLLDSESNEQENSTTEVQDLSVQTGYVFTLGSIFLTPQIRFQRDLELYAQDSGVYRFGHDYDAIHPSVALRSSKGNSVSVGYQIRNESEVVSGSLIESRSINTPEIRVVYGSGNSFTTDTRIGLQQTRVSAEYAQLTGSGDANGLAIRSVTSFSLFNEGITNEILYDLNTESRSLFQETYLEVGSEFGQYVWIDLNNDQIQQLDEFFPEQNPSEGTFILQLLPTDELRPVTSLRTSWTVRIDPIRWIADWRRKGLFGRILANIVYTSRIDFREQSETDRLTEFALLRPETILRSESTLQGNINWRQEVQFFRRIPTLDVLLRRNYLEGLNRQINGLQTNLSENWNLIGTYRFPENWSIEVDISTQKRLSFSETLVGRNYNISGLSFEPSVRYNFTGGSLTSLGIKFATNEDVNGTRATLFNISQDGTLFIGRRLRVLERIEFRSTKISQNVGPQLEFELTESIGVGNSLLWNLGIQWDNADWVRTTVQYDGRTIPGRGVIQTLRVAVTAMF